MNQIVSVAIWGLQKWCLAFYKKEFVSERNHPPLGYFVRIIKIRAHPDLPPKVLGCMRFSPDMQDTVPDFKEEELRTSGRYYHEGFVVMRIDYEERIAICDIHPGPEISLEKTFEKK